MGGPPLWVWLLVGISPMPFLLAVFIRRAREFPGTLWLQGMNVAIGCYLLSHVVHALFLRRRQWVLVADYLQITSSTVASVLWFAFLLAYTGQVRFGKQRRRLVVACLACICLLDWTDTVHGQLYAAVTLRQPGQVPFVDATPGVLYTAQLLGVFVLGLVGIGLLLRVLVAEQQLFSGQAAALLLGSASPYIATGLDLLDVEPAAAMPLLPFGFLGTGLALSYAATRSDLFEVVPATQRLGTNTALEQLPDGIVTTAANGTILNANERACRLLGVDRSALVGQQFATLHDDVSGPEMLPETIRRQGKIIETNCSPIEGSSGECLGYTVRYSNISGQVRRQQRLEVLHRLMRHNLRNKLTIIDGYAQRLETVDDSARREEYAQEIDHALGEITTLVEKSRTLEQTLDNEQMKASVDPTAVLQEVTTELESQWPAATIETYLSSGATCVTYRDQLRAVLWNLIENAVEHNTAQAPAVTVTATTNEGGIEYTITDDGPGIPRNEIEVIEAGTETQLQHGSGLGLWLVKWCVQDLNGNLDIETNSQGTTVNLQIPSLAD